MKESVRALLILFGLLPRLAGRRDEAEGRARAGDVTTGALPASHCESWVRLVEGRLGWADCVVDEQAEVKEVACELPQEADSEEEIDAAGVSKKLTREVVRAIGDECYEIARAMVKAAMEGHVQHLKVLMEILERAEKLQAAGAKTMRRSIASAWGAEPEWQEGGCANCAVRTAAA